VAGYQDSIKFETLRWIGNAANFSAYDPPGTISLWSTLWLHDSAGPRMAGTNRYEEEVGASVARCPRTPPDAAKTSGL